MRIIVIMFCLSALLGVLNANPKKIKTFDLKNLAPDRMQDKNMQQVVLFSNPQKKNKQKTSTLSNKHRSKIKQHKKELNCPRIQNSRKIPICVHPIAKTAKHLCCLMKSFKPENKQLDCTAGTYLPAELLPSDCIKDDFGLS